MFKTILPIKNYKKKRKPTKKSQTKTLYNSFYFVLFTFILFSIIYFYLQRKCFKSLIELIEIERRESYQKSVNDSNLLYVLIICIEIPILPAFLYKFEKIIRLLSC